MRGQSAIEYLMTYGWAIAILIIILGLLFTSGMFSPSYLVSDECELGPNFPCDPREDFRIYMEDGDTYLALRVYNGYGYKIYIKEIEAELLDPEKDIYFEPINAEVESGDRFEAEGVIENYEPPENSVEKIKVRMEYFICAEEINPNCDPADASYHNITGRIRGKVYYVE